MCQRLNASLQRFRNGTIAVRANMNGGCQSLAPIWSSHSGILEIITSLDDAADELKKLLGIMQNILEIDGYGPGRDKERREPHDRDPDGSSAGMAEA